MNWISDKAKALLSQWKERRQRLYVAVLAQDFRDSGEGIITYLSNDIFKVTVADGREVSFELLGARFSYEEIPPEVRPASPNAATHALHINFSNQMVVLSEWDIVAPGPLQEEENQTK